MEWNTLCFVPCGIFFCSGVIFILALSYSSAKPVLQGPPAHFPGFRFCFVVPTMYHPLLTALGSFSVLMDQEAKDLRPSRSPNEPNHFLQWGSRKRLRCVKTRGSPSPSSSDVLRRAIPRAARPLDIVPFRSPRRPSTIQQR
jgi:hypothetical protein